MEGQPLVGDGGERVGDGVDDFRAEVLEAILRARRCPGLATGFVVVVRRNEERFERVRGESFYGFTERMGFAVACAPAQSHRAGRVDTTRR